MPRIFRPSLNPSIQKTKQQEQINIKPNKSILSSISTTAQVIEYSESDKTPDELPFRDVQNVKDTESSKQIQFCSDADRLIALKPSTQETITSKPPDAHSDHNEETVVSHVHNIFNSRKQIKNKLVERLAVSIPDRDKPLDRSNVSLRDILNWTPSNKPPPSFRQQQHQQPKPCDSKSKKQTDQITVSTNETTQQPVVEEMHIKEDELAPRLVIDADGNLVLDETSLLVSRPDPFEGVDRRQRVDVDGGLVNYRSFLPSSAAPNQTVRWSYSETLRFYRALKTIGTDFYSMVKLFPNRHRRELVRKYKNECKRNPELVDTALSNRSNFDLTALMSLEDDEEEERKQDKEVNIDRQQMDEQCPESASVKPYQDQQSKALAGRGLKAKSKRDVKAKKGKVESAKPQKKTVRSSAETIDETIDQVLAQADVIQNHCLPTVKPSSSTFDQVQKIRTRSAKRHIDQMIDQIVKVTSNQEQPGPLCDSAGGDVGSPPPSIQADPPTKHPTTTNLLCEKTRLVHFGHTLLNDSCG